MIVAASPVSATSQDPDAGAGAPPGTPETRYCMRIEAITGSRIEELKCWTREEWAEQGVDVDHRLGQGRRPHHRVRIARAIRA